MLLPLLLLLLLLLLLGSLVLADDEEVEVEAEVEGGVLGRGGVVEVDADVVTFGDSCVTVDVIGTVVMLLLFGGAILTFKFLDGAANISTFSCRFGLFSVDE